MLKWQRKLLYKRPNYVAIWVIYSIFGRFLEETTSPTALPYAESGRERDVESRFSRRLQVFTTHKCVWHVYKCVWHVCRCTSVHSTLIGVGASVFSTFTGVHNTRRPHVSHAGMRAGRLLWAVTYKRAVHTCQCARHVLKDWI